MMILIITIGVCILFVALAAYGFWAKIANQRYFERKLQELDEDYVTAINGTSEEKKAFIKKYPPVKQC